MRATLPLPGDPASPPGDEDAIAPDSGYATKRYRNRHDRPFPHVRGGEVGRGPARLSHPLDRSCGPPRRRSPVPCPGGLCRADPAQQRENCAAPRESMLRLVITSQFLVALQAAAQDHLPVEQCRLPVEQCCLPGAQRRPHVWKEQPGLLDGEDVVHMLSLPKPDRNVQTNQHSPARARRFPWTENKQMRLPAPPPGSWQCSLPAARLPAPGRPRRVVVRSSGREASVIAVARIGWTNS
jgi:hypothetical protein